MIRGRRVRRELRARHYSSILGVALAGRTLAQDDRRGGFVATKAYK